MQVLRSTGFTLYPALQEVQNPKLGSKDRQAEGPLCCNLEAETQPVPTRKIKPESQQIPLAGAKPLMQERQLPLDWSYVLQLGLTLRQELVTVEKYCRSGQALLFKQIPF